MALRADGKWVVCGQMVDDDTSTGTRDHCCLVRVGTEVGKVGALDLQPRLCPQRFLVSHVTQTLFPPVQLGA